MTSTISVRDLLITYPVCSSVDPALFPDDIRLAVVFGDRGDKAIFITDDDEVFSFGSQNCHGVLGVGDENERVIPERVEELCGKRVIGIITGYEHMLALTASGAVYAWGDSGFHQLGNGMRSSVFTPQRCMAMCGHKVKQIACGRFHCLTLTTTAQVFGWGSNCCGQIGTGTTCPAVKPLLVQELVCSPLALIRCGLYTSFALTCGGVVYGWGENEHGQLGICRKGNLLIPTTIDCRLSVRFKDIAIGAGFSLGLTAEGGLYAWGCVKNTNKVSKLCQITKISRDKEKIVEIGTSLHSMLSAALTAEGIVMVIGLQKYVGLVDPLKVTAFKTLADAFRVLSESSVTCEPLRPVALSNSNTMKKEVKDVTGEESPKKYENYFNSEEFSDVQFIIEGKTIYAHADFLRTRSEYLRARLSEHWDRKKLELEVNGHSYSAFRSYLKYLYTGQLDVNTDNAMSFLRLSDEYLELELKSQCEEIAIGAITIENAFEIYLEAKQMSAKLLSRYCSDFIVSNLQEIVATEEFKCLDAQIVKDFISQSASSVTLRKNDFR